MPSRTEPTNINTRRITDFCKLITNPEVIKIKTIKKKYVDQIRFFPLTHEGYGSIETIGQTDGYIIVKHTDESLRKIAYADYNQFLQSLAYSRDDRRDHDANRRWAQDILDKIPQIFVD